jgi:hypothetical protein
MVMALRNGTTSWNVKCLYATNVIMLHARATAMLDIFKMKFVSKPNTRRREMIVMSK